MRKFIWILLIMFVFAGCKGQEPEAGMGVVIDVVQEPDTDIEKLPEGLLDIAFYESSPAFGDFILLTSNGKAGLADKDGAIVVPAGEYKAVEVRKPFILGARDGDIDFMNTNGRKLNVASVYGISYFYEGKAFALVEEKYYWLNETGSLERVEFEGAPCFLEKYNAIDYAGNEYALSRNGYIAYIDIPEGGAETAELQLMSFDGRQIPIPLAITVRPDDDYQIGSHNDLIYLRAQELFGAIDGYGNTVIPFEYDELKPAGEAGFIAKKAGKYGVIGNNGEVLLPCELIGIKEVKEELVVFETNDLKKNGVMNLQGEVILYPEYELIYVGEGRIVGRKDFSNRFVYAKNGLELSFGSFPPDGAFSNGLVSVMNENMKRGFAGFDGNVIVACEYDEVNTFQNGYAKVKKGELWGIVDMKGNVVVECKYDKIHGNGSFGFLLKMGNEWYYKSIQNREEPK